MPSNEKPDGTGRGGEVRPRHVRIPGFVADDDIGLGDAVKRVTYTLGVKRPCGGCDRRATALNRRMVLSPRRPRSGT